VNSTLFHLMSREEWYLELKMSSINPKEIILTHLSSSAQEWYDRDRQKTCTTQKLVSIMLESSNLHVAWINNRLQIHGSKEKLISDRTLWRKIENYYPAMALNNCCFIKCSSSWINCQDMFSRWKILGTWRIITLRERNDISHRKLVLSECSKKNRKNKHKPFKCSNNISQFPNCSTQ